MEPLPGAAEFSRAVRERTQLVILSDTFEQFAKPHMEKLSWPCLLCNSLVIGPDGGVTDYALRQANGKREAVKAFKSMNMTVFAAGDSFNDLAMIREADSGCLFRPPESIKKDCARLSGKANIPCVDTYDELLAEIDRFLETPFPHT
jgi:phosphoserine/homoserine phosphotransferase